MIDPNREKKQIVNSKLTRMEIINFVTFVFGVGSEC